MSETLFTYRTAQGPVGPYTVVFENDLLCFLGIGSEAAEEARTQWPTATAVTDQTQIALIDSLLTARQVKVRCVFHGNPLQVAVWSELAKIPYGTTVTYKEMATRIGKPEATRAVANAIGRNQISVVVPCHRVIGSDGALHGYRWGVEIKAALLALEKSGSGAHVSNKKKGAPEKNTGNKTTSKSTY